jgi:acyl-coenzyme A thioesterase PaaI-like protein
MVQGVSLQDRYAPNSICFGCGPANESGLRIKSRIAAQGAEGAAALVVVVCDWRPRPEHAAFDGVLSGGIIGTILDCHSNWTAAEALRRRGVAEAPPSTVTAEFAVRMRRPTPMDVELHLSARAVEVGEGSAVVESSLEASGKTTATFRGTFVSVGPGHPAYGRWR